MPLSTETLPNKALNGRELKEIAVQKFRQVLDSDCMFSEHIAYGRIAFTITATFHVANGNVQPFSVRTRAPREAPIEGEVPLKIGPGDDVGDLVSLEAKVDITNPNVERVAADLPIRVQGRKTTGPATEGNPFPEIETKEYRYDRSSVPAPEPLVVNDVSVREAAKVGAKPGRQRPVVYMGKDVSDETIPASALDGQSDLDAVSEEE